MGSGKREGARDFDPRFVDHGATAMQVRGYGSSTLTTTPPCTTASIPDRSQSKKLVANSCELCHIVGHCCTRERNRKRSLFRSRLADPAVLNPEPETRQDPWRRFVRQLVTVNRVSETSLVGNVLGPSELVPPLVRRRTCEVSVYEFDRC